MIASDHSIRSDHRRSAAYARRPRRSAERAGGEHARAGDREHVPVLARRDRAPARAAARRSSCSARRSPRGACRRSSPAPRPRRAEVERVPRRAPVRRRPTEANDCEIRRLQERRLPVSARSARNPCRRPRKSEFAVAVSASGDSRRHVSDVQRRSAPVAAVTDASPQRAAPPTVLKPPARYTTEPDAATPVAMPERMIGWNAVRVPVVALAPNASCDEPFRPRCVLPTTNTSEPLAAIDADEDLRPGRRERQRRVHGGACPRIRGSAGRPAPRSRARPTASTSGRPAPLAAGTRDRPCRPR